jgi:nitrogen fixation protein FixH
MSTATETRPFTGRHMLAIVVAFFGVVAAVNVGMAVVATTSWTGLVVTNSYVAGQEFEEKRLAHEAQIRAGWMSDLSYGEGTVRLRVADASGKAVELGEVRVLFNRPVGGHEDQTIALSSIGDGRYGGTVDLGAGVWEVTASAPETPLGPFELRTRIRIEGAGQ